jgi:hypothetical protein
MMRRRKDTRLWICGVDRFRDSIQDSHKWDNYEQGYRNRSREIVILIDLISQKKSGQPMRPQEKKIEMMVSVKPPLCNESKKP